MPYLGRANLTETCIIQNLVGPVHAVEIYTPCLLVVGDSTGANRQD